uniref:Signal peptidase complex subunit 2 n=1 Tax=Lotharella globosa TaxID=91324 RepID=A0A6V3QYR4_9EUKA|mmetsp:Transcript_12329/g.25083  ORF Transcript_12329/g.25083 Transcript_12329/m.25083 type:complete len:192 (+) Transcript_12329:62-637(+)|eukprot:CAMPEP_0167778354 /NCGR_PEP_ID=MMETSP0111_2-20121227/4207_1 /TAXON_ID=91324 /ORGANISM="Lotharella globosa, Strain CCCM811" /LENGTH=191 /DNA_ID=CAMNT_0007668649 /DNA_START=62 /DNA_END=637 /DNA_ORIENTATION=-
MGAVMGGGAPNEGQKANVFDPSAIKAVLDLSTVQAMRKEGYEEDHLHSNLKLSLGFLACLVGASAYIYPIPFPDNRQFLKWCVILYFAFSSLIQTITYIFFRDVAFVSKCKSSPGMKSDYYFRITSKLPRYHTKYKLTLKGIMNDQAFPLVREVDIQDYFDRDGYFYEKKYWKHLKEIHAEALELLGKKSK